MPLTLSEIVSSISSSESSSGVMTIAATALPIPLGSALRFSAVSGGSIVAIALGIVNAAVAAAAKPTTLAFPLPVASTTASCPVNALV